MESGDGWIVRLRPRGGRLTPEQALAVADAAERFGNGVIELTGRANLQLRGVTPGSHAPLIAALDAAGLIDADPATEARRNLIVTPFADARADALAARFEAALAANALPLPAKFGFALDCGPAPVLQGDPADIRIERGQTGLILRADGMARGVAFAGPGQALDLARWFLAQGGSEGGRGRMAALIARGICPPGADLPARPGARPQPGPCPQGVLVALEFGQIAPRTLRALGRQGALRITPWRMVLAGGGADPRGLGALPGVILSGADPRLRLRACPGAPACASAHAATRSAARRLAPLVPQGAVLHVSGCAKGCAWPRKAALVLTATEAGFDLIRDGRAGDPAVLRGLRDDELAGVL